MPDTLFRHVPITVTRDQSKRAEGGEAITISASSEAPVERYGEDEILVHDASAIRLGRLQEIGVLLFNHDRDMPIGRVENPRIEGGRLMVDIHFSGTDDGRRFAALVEEGTLRGVSIAYRVYAWEFVEAEAGSDMPRDQIRATDWEPLEVSIVSVPADATVGVGRSDAAPDREAWRALTASVREKHDSTAAHAAQHTEAVMPDNEKRAGNDPATDDQRHDGAGDHPTPPDTSRQDAAHDEAARAAFVREAREVEEFARSHGITDSVVGKTMAEVRDMALEHHKRALKDACPAPREQVSPITVGDTQEDKAERAAESFLFDRVGIRQDAEGNKIDVRNNPLRGRSYLDAGIRWAEMHGIRGIRDWSRNDQAHFVLGDFRNMSATARRDAANVINASFSSFVTLDAISKIVAAGFEQTPRSVNYQLWSQTNLVPDFKAFKVGSLGTQNLQETAENEAFPELDKSEGVYSDTVKMWGGTLSLTLQALVNDDTGEFDRGLRAVGPIAQKTINRRAYQKLLMGTSTDTATSTWTNNTTTGDIQYATADAAYAARAALDDVIAALMNKTGQDGNPLGTVPSILLVAPGLAGQARGITGAVAPGQVTTQQAGDGDILVVTSPWLSTGSGLTGADSAHYYLMADPMDVTGMLISFIRDMQAPQAIEYDAGATAARKFKFFQPFECSLVNQANKAGTSIIAAAQQGTD